MIKEPFALGDSWMHRIDPRLRVLTAAVLSILLALSYDLTTLLWGLGIALVSALTARLSIGRVVRHLIAPAAFLFLLWLVLPWSFEGEVMTRIGPLALTRPGVVLCLQITLKTLALVVLFMALLATMTTDTLGHTLGQLHLPDKLIHLLLITYRYIFVIEQEYHRLQRAIKIRSFRPKTNLHSYRTYAYLVGMLFVRASERARRVHHAMICRGFTGRFVSLRAYPSHVGNFVFTLGAGLVMLWTIILEWII